MERRLTTIVAVDIAGFSRLIGLDEEGTLAAQRDHRAQLVDSLLEIHGGRIANTAGDSLLIEFSSAVEALRCSVAIQEGMVERNAVISDDRRILYRCGINVGDVVAEGDDLLGDGVNIAARLEALAPPGGIVVSRSVRDNVRDRLKLTLADLGEVEVKNIARPVRAFQVIREGETPIASVRRRASSRLVIMAGLAALVTIALAGAFAAGLFSDAQRADADRRPVLIVLPFDNLSGDMEQDYFSDGFTEDLTTALAGIPGLMVVARNTAFTFKGEAIDVRELGRRLNVRYVVEGSARRMGDAVRINAQLIDAESGTNIWAQRFDRPFREIFIVENELADRIVGTVAAQLRRYESKKAMEASEDTLEAYDLTLRARVLFRRNTLASVSEARVLLHRAVESDPDYAEAFSLLAQVENFFFTSRVSVEYAEPDTAQRVVAAANNAVRLAPDNAFAHAVHGMSLRLTRDYDGAAREARTARALAPNDSDVLATVSVILLSVGDYKNSVETMRVAWVLDPYLSPVFIGVILSQGHHALGQFEEAREVALACLQRTPDDVRCHESLVRALGELGPPEAAKKAADKLLELSPAYTVAEYRRRASRNRNDTSAIDRWAEGLRKAGVPEK